MRRRAGVLLYLVGGALLLHAGSTYARGALARSEARSAWEQADARRAVSDARTIDLDGGDALVRQGSPIARLLIPAIGLDEVVVEGVGDDELNAGPGHLPGSAVPGEAGNAVISAHRDRHFSSLGDLRIGDTVHTETISGRTSWVVTTRRVVRAGKPALFSSEQPLLTLTTCWPLRALGPAPERLIIEAKQIAD